MKVCISMWSVHAYFFNQTWNTADFVRYAGQLGVEGVELLSLFWRDQVKELPVIKEALKSHQLLPACYCACNNFVVKESKARQEQLEEVTGAVDMAAELGAGVVRVFSGDLPDDGSITYDQGMEYVLEGLSRAAEYAAKQNIVLSLENHGLFAGKSDQVLAIIRHINSPYLTSNFDTGNFLLVGQDPDEAIDELAQMISHVHVKDFLKVNEKTEGQLYPALNGEWYTGCIPGEGQVNLSSIFSKLSASGYDGWISIEFEGNEEPMAGTARSVDYVKKLLSSLP